MDNIIHWSIMNWFGKIKVMNWSDDYAKRMIVYEVPNMMFSPYLYESQGIEIPLSTSEIDKIFWDAASPGDATEGMKEFGMLATNWSVILRERLVLE